MSARDDGFTVCHNCGAKYSKVLSACPGCGEETPKGNMPVIHRRYLCNAGYLCQIGKPDEFCCISCQGYKSCKKPCDKAKIWMTHKGLGLAEYEDDLPMIYRKRLCEYLIKEDASPWQ